jgi:multisubunit Na+/H+ antiporter MnhB subunit
MAKKKDRTRMDKTGMAFGVMIAVAVLTTLFFYLKGAGDIELSEIFLVGIVLIIVFFAVYILWDRFSNVRLGLPAKDEMEKKINWRAGYYGFIAAIWGAVFGPLLIDILFGYELEGSRVTALVVLVSGLTFVVSYLYLRRKGIEE